MRDRKLASQRLDPKSPKKGITKMLYGPWFESWFKQILETLIEICIYEQKFHFERVGNRNISWNSLKRSECWLIHNWYLHCMCKKYWGLGVRICIIESSPRNQRWLIPFWYYMSISRLKKKKKEKSKPPTHTHTHIYNIIYRSDHLKKIRRNITISRDLNE